MKKSVRKNEAPDLEYLRALAQQVGFIMQDAFYGPHTREWKPEGGGFSETPVLAADKAINDFVLQSIVTDFPRMNALGEEGSRKIPKAEYMVAWDPIDGTNAYMIGAAISAFCISVLHRGTPIRSVIYDPLGFRPRMWFAEQGGGAFLNGRPLTKSLRHSELKRAHICLVWWHGCRYNLHEVAGKLMEAGAIVSNPLSLAYYGGLVASGTLEAAMFPGTAIWEAAAMQPIIEEAGGCITNIFGDPIRYDRGNIAGCIVSGNNAIHDAILRVVAECN